MPRSLKTKEEWGAAQDEPGQSRPGSLKSRMMMNRALAPERDGRRMVVKCTQSGDELAQL